MDVPTPINYQNIQINNISKENENLIDLNGVLVQFPYIDSLKEKEKKEYDQKNNACCCCGNGANNYICQIFVLYIILFFFIICSIIFRISTIPRYNILRNQDLANFKLYSTAYTTSSIKNIIIIIILFIIKIIHINIMKIVHYLIMKMGDVQDYNMKWKMVVIFIIII